MKSFVVRSIILSTGVFSLLAGPAGAADLRFDVSTNNNAVLLPNLAFPSANGHIDLLGGTTYQSTLTNSGNTLGEYYNDFNQQADSTSSFTDYPNPHDMAVAVQTYVNQFYTTPGSQSGWVALNEISSSTWQSNPVNSAGIDYRTWCADVVSLLKNGDSTDPSHIVPAHTGVILWAPFSNPTGNASSWQAIAKNAVIGDECYINAPTIQSDGFKVSTVQSFYQSSYNAWTALGIPAKDLLLTSEFTVSTAGNGYGADGLSGTAWQEAIECMDLAAYNTNFGAFCGYAWGKNAQGATDATLISYENAYASTMVLQSEVPCWTGNNGSTSWADYLNWTGGLPSTTSAPYPLLAAANPNLPKQTSANFQNTIKANTTITLDGNQSVTNLSFNSSFSYTIAPGTGGSLTLSGSGASISVVNGSHAISANTVLASPTTANLTGNLTLSGGVTNNGVALTKSGAGTLTISGPQTNAAGSSISVTAGTLNLNTDAGSASASNLALSQAGGTTNVNSSQHLASISLTSGSTAIAATDLVQIASTLSSTGGQLSAHTAGISIDNPSITALTLTGGPHDILLDFDTTGNLSSGPYWGLRWQGDHVAALQAYLNGEISIESNPSYFNPNDLAVGTMSVNGVQYSYVGFANIVPEPASCLAALGLVALTRRRHPRPDRVVGKSL